MRKSSFFLVVLTVLFCCASIQTEAQILKRLGDKIERSVERRVDKKMDQAVEKTLDEAEEGTGQVVNDALKSKDGSGEEVVEGSQDGSPTAPGKSIIRNLPENFKLELKGSGPDLFMQYQVRVLGEAMEAHQMEMAMKLYSSPSKGRARGETVMNMPIVGEMRAVTLTDFDNPSQITIINDKRKEYSVIDVSDAEVPEPEEQFTITRLGEEDVYGLRCVHSKAVNDEGAAFEIWTTTEVPGYEDIVALYSKTQNMGSGNMWAELQKADAAGFMVKMQMSVETGTTIMELVQIEKTTVPESMLTVPAGYEKKAAGRGLNNLMLPGR